MNKTKSVFVSTTVASAQSFNLALTIPVLSIQPEMNICPWQHQVKDIPVCFIHNGSKLQRTPGSVDDRMGRQSLQYLNNGKTIHAEG